jgi:hypothetical protein
MANYIKKNNNSTQWYVVLPGANGGMGTGFMKNIFQKLDLLGRSYLAFNYPFQERGEHSSSGLELEEEVAELKKYLALIKKENGKVDFVFIVKSMGGVVLEKFLIKYPGFNPRIKKIFVMGCLVDDIRFENYHDIFVVVQGEFDKHGTENEIINKYMGRGENFHFHMIKGADHSYNSSVAKDGKYEDEAIQFLN